MLVMMLSVGWRSIEIVVEGDCFNVLQEISLGLERNKIAWHHTETRDWLDSYIVSYI